MTFQTKHSDTADWGVDRRTVLKGIGAGAGAMAFGIPMIGGARGAVDTTPDGLRFYAVTPSTGDDLSSESEQYLIRFDPATQTVDEYQKINVDTTYFPADTIFRMPSISVHPVTGMVYGIAINRLTHAVSGDTGRGWLIEIDPSTGTAAPVNDNNVAPLRSIWGTTFAHPTNTSSNWVLYGVHVGRDSLYSIDITTGVATEIGGLGTYTDPDTDEVLPFDAVHTGLGYEISGNQIWATLGNQPLGANDLLVTIDQTTGAATLVAKNVFTAGILVGTETDPCDARFVYSIRGGSTLYVYDRVDDDFEQLGPVSLPTALSDVTVKFDNLAVALYDCGECVECESGEDLLVKYEWDDETGAFYPEGSLDENISIDSVTYNDEGEPIEVCFTSDYCTLEAVVKAATTVETIPVSDASSFCVETPDEFERAISYVAFYCVAPEDAHPGRGSEREANTR